MNKTANGEIVSGCDSRREFLVKAGFLAGGIVLTLSGAASAFEPAFDDLTVQIDDKSPLHQVGGFTILESTAGKIAVVRTGETSFVAVSAKCTHKGGIVDYDSAKKQFVCPKHGSTFDGATGAVMDGPADVSLHAYTAKGSASSVTIDLS